MGLGTAMGVSSTSSSGAVSKVYWASCLHKPSAVLSLSMSRIKLDAWAWLRKKRWYRFLIVDSVAAALVDLDVMVASTRQEPEEATRKKLQWLTL